MARWFPQALALLRPTSGTQRFESAPPAGGLLVAPPISSAASRIQPDAVARILVVDDARVAVKTAVEYLDEEERWVLLQRWLEKETTGMSWAANRSLRLEALRSIVCPRIGDREWDGIVREHRKVEWAGELRRANARAILPVQPSEVG